MKYDIYFHNDFDGWASAAVIVAFLKSRGDEVEHYVQIDFHLEEQWFHKNFFRAHRLFRGRRNPAIVVDFLYHPKAAIWFDHHLTTFRDSDWRKFYRPDRFHVLNTHFLSCCHLVYASLKKSFSWEPPRHLQGLVRWLDIVDGARYASPQQPFALKEPALRVDAFIDQIKWNSPKAAWMVKLLAERPLSYIARLPNVKRVADRVRRENRRALQFYRKNMKVFGNATFINLINARVSPLRYASYQLFPKIRYGVRFTVKGPLYHVGVGSNPWMDIRHSVHIGKFLRRYGGGGHKGAGAVDFKRRSDAEKAVREILAFLSRKK